MGQVHSLPPDAVAATRGGPTRPLVIAGTGTVGQLAAFYFETDGGRTIAAFTVDDTHRTVDSIDGLPVVPFERVAETYPPDRYDLFVAFGYRRINYDANRFRERRYHDARALGYTLASYVSSRSIVSPGTLEGDNCLVMEGALVQPFATVGSNVILWSGAHVGHGSRIGDHTFLAAHAVVSGNVTVEANAFLGSNCTIRDGVTIATSCVIGAGTVIAHDTLPRGVYASPPGRALPMTSDELPQL
jgi:sugar O-acyltransferase (sialic acid O-acetyltransferase NeuD family)